MSTIPKLGGIERWSFATGGLTFGILNNGLAYFLLFYYNQVLGLSGFYAGMAILISMIFDSVSDPLIGVWSDKLRSRWGRRHPFMYVSAIPIPIFYICLWFPPEVSEFGLFVYLTMSATLLRFSMTLFEIPSVSMLAELTEDYDERTRLAGLRYMMGWIGGLTMASLMWGYYIENFGELNKVSYQYSGMLSATIVFVAVLAASIGLHKRIPHLKKVVEGPSIKIGQLLNELRTTIANQNFAALFFAAIFAAIAGGVKANFETYVMLHFWEFSPEQIQWLLVALFVSAILAVFLSSKLTSYFDKKGGLFRIYAFSIIFAALPYMLRLIGMFPENGSPYLYPIVLVHQVLDVTLVVMSAIIITSMLADVVDDSEAKTGRREEGFFFSANTFAAKATTGIGVLVAGLALDYIEFPTAAVQGEVSPSIVWELGFIYGPAMMIFYTIALYAISFYSITRKEHDQRVQEAKAKLEY